MLNKHPSNIAIMAIAFLIAFILQNTGCTRRPEPPRNLELFASLRTAVSARNIEWLDMNKEVIRQRYEEGEMSETTYTMLTDIIAKAREGKWAEAEDDIIAIQKTTRPASADEGPEQPHSHDHDHEHSH